MSVTGIGGIRFGCPDPDGLRAWYADHLDIEFDSCGMAWFHWNEPTGAPAASVLAPHAASTDGPGDASFSVIYRVVDLSGLQSLLESDGHTVEVASLPGGGRVARVVDPDGQRIELREGSADLPDPTTDRGPVVGIGGIFLRSGDVAGLKSWYEKLGIIPGPDGYVTFDSILSDGTAAFTAWEVFHDGTTYFDSDGEKSRHRFMLNFRVKDLDALLERLRGTNVWVDPRTESYEYGKFGWIVDPLGARIELWEPQET